MAKVVTSGYERISCDILQLIFSNGTWDVREQGNRTGNPKIPEGLFRFLQCIPCPAGLRPLKPAPDGRQVQGRLTIPLRCSRWSHCSGIVLQACVSSPVGRFLFSLHDYLHSRKDSITLKR